MQESDQYQIALTRLYVQATDHFDLMMKISCGGNKVASRLSATSLTMLFLS